LPWPLHRTRQFNNSCITMANYSVQLHRPPYTGITCYILHLPHFIPKSSCDQFCSMFTLQPDSRFVSAARH
jgi:hypothetical protein